MMGHSYVRRDLNSGIFLYMEGPIEIHYIHMNSIVSCSHNLKYNS